MAEFLLDDDPLMTQWVTPDPEGFTLRTRHKGTQEVLDQNAELRADSPKNFKDKDGVHYHHVMRVPGEVMEVLYRRLGRMPTAQELLQFGDDRDFSKLKTKDARLT